MIDELLSVFSFRILQFNKKPCTSILNLYFSLIDQHLNHTKTEVDMT
ncbi:hypothetical protein COO91_08026 [Nostoc flagelliforme CCNUN1]|uniref:Uncharacterized protein n=1 Tax=Nostoc flagelliforme CCNUN1 TaxID=2038116 RepID=A0A2K8T4K6_9NOSO|nr:hypothetical protein COO91_08026 [Nostoc flagelliforme CCNUN1]